MTNEFIFLLQAFVIITVPYGVSRLLRLDGMVPLVVIQILLGIAFGPSLFGRIAPHAYGMLFNASTLAPLSGAASIAVLFFGFITGLHLDVDTLRGRGNAFAAIAAASVVIPTALGVATGLLLAIRHPGELGPRGDLFTISTAIGICLGVTALPVLGAVLREMDLLGQRIGSLALGIAAVNDATLWLFLGVLMTMAAGQSQSGMLFSALALPVYFLLMVRFVRPLLTRAAAALSESSFGEAQLILISGSAVGSATITQALGLHYIFGAFIAGAIIPRELRKSILDRLQVMTIVVLMPFFFMLAGLRTRIDLSSALFAEIFLVTTVIGIAGKVGGTTITALLAGETWRTALCLGTLAQTKGLMEVVVLTILLEDRIISTTAFSALTLMAVISTGLVMPVARFILSGGTAIVPRRNAAQLAVAAKHERR